MGKLTQEQKKMVREAELFYLNGCFQKAYSIFKLTIQESKLLESTEDPEGVLCSTIRIINKIELSEQSRTKPAKQQKTDALEFRDKVFTKVIQTPGIFPPNITDRFLLLEYKPEEFSKLYYTSISANNSQQAHNILATINYDAYFRDPSPQRSYDIFLATSSPFYPEFFIFSALINLNQENLDKVFRDLSNYGLSSQALRRCNDWGDSLAHRSIWWGGGSGVDKALVHLKYSEKFPNNFLQRYLHELRNHQGENWLDDVARHTHEDSLVSEFVKFLETKKLHHLTLLKKSQQEYFQIAVLQENHEFVRGVLGFIKRKVDETKIEQRTFNLNAFELPQTYSSGQLATLDLMRKMGILEYREDLENYEQKFAQDSQNVHRARFADPLVDAAKRLESHYNSSNTENFIETQSQSFISFFYSILDSVGVDKIVEFLTRQKCIIKEGKLLEEFLGGAEFTLSRIVNIDQLTKYNPELFKASKEFGYPQTKAVYTNLTLKHALSYVWAGLTDKNALSQRVLDEAEVLERSLSLVLVLYSTYIDGIKDAEQVAATDEDVVMTEAIFSKSEQDLTESLSHEKVKGIICITGLFQRMIDRLDKQHHLVDIQISNVPYTKITLQSVANSTKSIGNNLLGKLEYNLLLFARLCDNFELFMSRDLTEKFIPSFQHCIGLLKEIFSSDILELGYLGDQRAITEAEKREVFIIFENIIKNLQLSNLFKSALDQIKDQNITSIQLQGLYLKIFLDGLNLTQELHNYKILFAILLIDKVKQTNESITVEHGANKVLEAALNMSSPSRQDVLEQFQAMPAYKQLSEMMQQILIEVSTSPPEKKCLIEKVSQTIRALASKQEWDGHDIVKFHIITSENPIFRQENIIVDLFKHAILQSNLYMLKATINKAEYLYERQLALDDYAGSQKKYNNKYLEKVASKDFADGMNLLHLAAKHSKSAPLIDLLLTYHEFREKLDIQDKRGCTPFYIAAFNQNEVAIGQFIEYGADINILDSFGTAPILVLASQGRLDIVQRLIECGANPFISDSAKSTFIHRAALAEKDKSHHMSYEDFEEYIMEKAPISEEILPYCSNFIYEILGESRIDFE